MAPGCVLAILWVRDDETGEGPFRVLAPLRELRALLLISALKTQLALIFTVSGPQVLL